MDFMGKVFELGVNPFGLDTGAWGPLDHNMLAWTFPPELIQNGAGVAAGVVSVSAIKIVKTVTVTNALVNVNTAGATLTAGSCFIALYNPAKGIIGKAAIETVTNTAGLKTIALTATSAGTLTNLVAGKYYIAWWHNGTTIPLFGRAANLPASNAGLTAANSRSANADTGVTTTAPATLGAFTANVNLYWAGLS